VIPLEVGRLDRNPQQITGSMNQSSNFFLKLKIGDLSTLIHEPAHAYLEMIGDPNVWDEPATAS
jgi:hypothetical protein